VAEEANGQRLVAAGELLRQQCRRRGVDGGRRQIEVFEPVLLGEQAGKAACENPAARDDDLADPPAGLLLFGERQLELLGRQQPVADEQRPERYARRLRRQHQR
jgi:hypothetical protein